MIRLFEIGNNYEGESYSLPDCELDASNIADTFGPYCETVSSVIGKAATRKGIFAAVRKSMATLKPGDMWLVYNSGHGTTDTVRGKRVEAIVCTGGTLIYDFEIQAELAKRPAKVMLVAMSDSCYSGGLSRAISEFRGRKPAGNVRTVPVSKLIRHDAELPTGRLPKPNAVFSACNKNEVSYSTGEGGAMTNALLEAFAERTENSTLPALYSRIRKLLPSDEWPQHPQFQIDPALKRKTIKSFNS